MKSHWIVLSGCCGFLFFVGMCITLFAVGYAEGVRHRDREWRVATGLVVDSLTYDSPNVSGEGSTPESFLKLVTDKANKLREEQNVRGESVMTFGIRKTGTSAWIPARGR